MAAAVPLLIAPVGAPLLEVLGAQDAMGASDIDQGGFGVVAAAVSRDLIESFFETGTCVARSVACLNSGGGAPGNPWER